VVESEEGKSMKKNGMGWASSMVLSSIQKTMEEDKHTPVSVYIRPE